VLQTLAIESLAGLIEEAFLSACRILIVEDETMIAMMIEDFLTELGWKVVGVAGTPERAMAMAQEARIDAALLDVNLSGRDTYAAADILLQRGIPFVFATGYGLEGIADRFRGVPTLTKPFKRDELARALRRAMAGTGGPPRAAPQPSRAAAGTAASAGRKPRPRASARSAAAPRSCR
jgi:CheY-like chemotaxis protein